MYSDTFIFDKKQFDAEFYTLDDVTAEIAKQTSGYIGEERWENPSTGRLCNVYYLQSMDGLQGYEVYNSQIISAYGDGAIDHPTKNLVA